MFAHWQVTEADCLSFPHHIQTMGYFVNRQLEGFIPSSINGLRSQNSLKSTKYYMIPFMKDLSDDIIHALQSDWNAKILVHGTKIEMALHRTLFLCMQVKRGWARDQQLVTGFLRCAALLPQVENRGTKCGSHMMVQGDQFSTSDSLEAPLWTVWGDHLKEGPFKVIMTDPVLSTASLC